jgi:hypothetical protein
MKPIGVISTAVLLLLIGTNAPTYAQQQDQQEKDKQKQQQDQNKQRDRQGDRDQDSEQQRGQRQQQQDQNRQRDQDREQQRAQQQQDKDKQKQQRDQNSEQQRAQQPQQQEKGDQRRQKQHRQEVDERSRPDQVQRESAQKYAWQQNRAKNRHFEHRTWQDRGGYSGYRIPDDQFRDNFGENHFFRIYNRPVVVVGGYPRFQYGGYWFSLVDPWPEYWSDDWYDRDEVYIAYLDDGYYLYDRRYPGDRIAVSVYVN